MRIDARVGKLLGVAVLYALGGALCNSLANWVAQLMNHFGWFPPLGVFGLFPVAIPFTLISVALFLRTWKAVLSALLNLVVYPAAYAIAQQMAHSEWPIPGLFLAGFAGGLGVALADSICQPKLFTFEHLGAAAFIGMITAWTFFMSSFAEVALYVVWQASVGTYLYYVCTDGRKSAEVADTPQG